MKKIPIIIAEWAGFPLYRERVCKGASVTCGLGHILENMHKHPAGMAFEVFPIINKNSPFEKASFYEELRSSFSFINKIFFRDNIGQDFGAYNFGYQFLDNLAYTGDVLFLNTTINGPNHDNWLSTFYDLFHKRSDIGLCSISLHSHNTNERSNPYAPHIGSYLFYSNMRILRKTFGKNLPAATLEDKNLIISEGEIKLSRDIMDHGYKICSVENKNFFFNYNDGPAENFPSGDTNLNRFF